MTRRARLAVLLICAAAMSAAAADLHCAIARPSSASVIVVCSASRLEAQR